jgi:hypothetical protein
MSSTDFNDVSEDVEEEAAEQEDGQPQSLEDVGLAKGVVLSIKYMLGQDLGEYDSLLGGGEDVTLSEQQKDLISPSAADFSNATFAHVGQQYTKSGFTNAFPNEPSDLYLQTAFGQPMTNNDIAIHIDPYDQKDALSFLKKQAENLKAEFDMTSDEYDMNSRRGRYEAARTMRDMVEESPTELFDVSMYVTARGNTEENVKKAWMDIKGKLTTSPALTQQIVASYIQDKALRTTSPIAKDFVGYKRQMLGGALGAMLPFTSTSLIEEGGVMFGIHQYNNSPVFVSRFDRPSSFNQITVGESGSGKSFSTKLNVLRTYGGRDDTMFVMLEPLSSFQKFTKVLNGAHVPVGGNVGINMMEIHPPRDINEAVAGGHNPFGQKVEQVSTLLRSHFRKENIPLGERVSTLDDAIIHTYHRFGITSDIETHEVPLDEQPTVKDLMETLDIMRSEPERFTYNPENVDLSDDVEESAKEDARLVEDYTDSSFTTEADVIRQHARDLILGLRAFQPGGKYDMLARHTEVDIAGATMVYLDLEADEMEDDTGLMMQLLFNMVYERAKEEEKNVVFAIDEAHVLMDDEDTLGMLSRAVRHARHYDLSINFITQQPADFFKNEKAKVIADNCTIKLIHQTSGLDERTANAVGLTPSLASKARGLRTGKRKGDTLFGSPYSEGLLYVSPYGWIPIYVSASPVEAAIVDAKMTDEQEMLDHLYRVDNTR